MSDDDTQQPYGLEGPVPVEVTNAHELRCPSAAYKTTAHTIELASATDIEVLLPEDPTRVEAVILPGSGAFWICNSRGQAQAAANGSKTSGASYPASTTAPVPVRGVNQMWAVGAAADTFPVYVSLLVTTKIPG